MGLATVKLMGDSGAALSGVVVLGPSVPATHQEDTEHGEGSAPPLSACISLWDLLLEQSQDETKAHF